MKTLVCLLLAILLTFAGFGQTSAWAILPEQVTTSSSELNGIYGCIIEPKTRRPVFAMHLEPTDEEYNPIDNQNPNRSRIIRGLRGSIVFDTTGNPPVRVPFGSVRDSAKQGSAYALTTFAPDGGLIALAIGPRVFSFTTFKVPTVATWLENIKNSKSLSKSPLYQLVGISKTKPPFGLCYEEKETDDNYKKTVFNGAWDAVKQQVSQPSLQIDLGTAVITVLLSVGEFFKALFGLPGSNLSPGGQI